MQEKGRVEIFADYHLRVGEITDDTAPPADLLVAEQRFDGTEIGGAKVVAITELAPCKRGTLSARPDTLPAHLGLDTSDAGLVDHEVFESIYNPGKLLLLTSWRDLKAAAWHPVTPETAASLQHRRVRIIRDYGMFDRREAPQYYPAVEHATAAQSHSKSELGGGSLKMATIQTNRSTSEGAGAPNLRVVGSVLARG